MNKLKRYDATYLQKQFNIASKLFDTDGRRIQLFDSLFYLATNPKTGHLLISTREIYDALHKSNLSSSGEVTSLSEFTARVLSGYYNMKVVDNGYDEFVVMPREEMDVVSVRMAFNRSVNVAMSYDTCVAKEISSEVIEVNVLASRVYRIDAQAIGSLYVPLPDATKSPSIIDRYPDAGSW